MEKTSPNATEPTLVIPQAGLEHFGKILGEDLGRTGLGLERHRRSPGRPVRLLRVLTSSKYHQGRGLVLVSEENFRKEAGDLKCPTDLIQVGAGPERRRTDRTPQSVLDRWNHPGSPFLSAKSWTESFATPLLRQNLHRRYAGPEVELVPKNLPSQ